MNGSYSSGTPPQPSRTLIESVEREFARLDERTRDLIHEISDAQLYQSTLTPGVNGASLGELILRSAGAIEQTFGGLTANLWDDPFEWTLPETLSTRNLITEYLDEVAGTRTAFFSRLKHDGDLAKLIAVPSGDTQPLIRPLLETLVRGTGYLERAFVILLSLSAAGRSQV